VPRGEGYRPATVALRIPLGISDFRKLREEGLAYVDKSHLIRELLDKGTESVLLPRPRRFGKTLALSMLQCFFEKRDEDLSGLFADLSIWQAGDEYRAHFQRYPVIFVTFKDVKAETWDKAWDGIRTKIELLFRAHAYLLDGGRLDEWEVRDFRAVVDATAGPALYDRALLDLSGYLHRHHGERVVVLVDEYDQPIHAGYTREAVGFFRAFLNAGLKDNPHVFKGVLTGILRIAKESIFSGLNNLGVHSLLDRNFATCFGFTEPEVAALFDRAGISARLKAARTWYNGYIFGETVIYNPWSILSFIDAGEQAPRPFWVTTSSNDLIREVLQRHAFTLQPAIEALLEGGAVERFVNENVVLSDLDEDEDTLWSLLLFSGYLKAEMQSLGPDERPAYRLSIPNLEVREVYTSTFRRWMAQRLKGHGGDVDRLLTALLAGDAETLEEQMQAFTMNVLSYHDTGLRPEQVYHAFVIGLLASLPPAHDVRSNRESGHGRPDVMIRPRRGVGPGVVLELKVARRGKKTMAQALAEGAAQIQEGGYVAELQAAGAAPIHAMVVGFDGKRVKVRSVEGEAEKGRAPKGRTRGKAGGKRKSPR
jgi:Predicted AAA-ATPase/PD-(D/E)XK nuclease superfamily